MLPLAQKKKTKVERSDGLIEFAYTPESYAYGMLSWMAKDWRVPRWKAPERGVKEDLVLKEMLKWCATECGVVGGAEEELGAGFD